MYDASAKTKSSNNSLNNCPEGGPTLLPDVCGILVRFRLNPIAMTSDVEKAFLHVGLSMPGRDITRFLWLKNGCEPVYEDNLVVYRFCRVPFRVISSPFLLAATLDHHLEKVGTEVASDIWLNTYVDNVIGGATTTEEANSYYKERKELFRQAGMNLREWSSNSMEFLQSIPEGDGASESQQTDTKILGMKWNTTQDIIAVAPTAFHNLHVKTKRDLVSAVAQFYDPLGLFSPVIVRAKLLIQTVCQTSHPDSMPNFSSRQYAKLLIQTVCQTSHPDSMETRL